MRMTSHKTVLLGSLSLILCVMAGCAAIIDLPYYRDYQGEALPSEDVAYITHPFPYSQTLFIREVDGVKTFWILGAIELRPGQHSITCTYGTTKGNEVYGSEQAGTFTFDIKAGRMYVMKAEEFIGDDANLRWRLRLRDITDEAKDGKYSAAFDEIDNYKQKIREGKALSAVRGNTTKPAPMQ